METENFIIKAILSGLIVIIAMCQTGCVGPLGSLGGTETHSIYSDMKIKLMQLENDTERKRQAND